MVSAVVVPMSRKARDMGHPRLDGAIGKQHANGRPGPPASRNPERSWRRISGRVAGLLISRRRPGTDGTSPIFRRMEIGERPVCPQFLSLRRTHARLSNFSRCCLRISFKSVTFLSYFAICSSSFGRVSNKAILTPDIATTIAKANIKMVTMSRTKKVSAALGSTVAAYSSMTECRSVRRIIPIHMKIRVPKIVRKVPR